MKIYKVTGSDAELHLADGEKRHPDAYDYVYLASDVEADRKELINAGLVQALRIRELEKALRFYAEARDFYMWDKDGNYIDDGNAVARALMESK